MNNVTERNDEQQSPSISCLHYGRYKRSALIRNAKLVCEDIQDRMCVVKVPHTERCNL